MHCSFSKTILAAFSVISIASAGPISARQVCGAAPTGSVAQAPLAQPSGIATAADCAAQCKGNPACLSFLFGLVDGVDKCILYSVSASSLPPSTNLVAYDIGCTSIPSVVPTTSNPGGLARRQGTGAPGTTTGSQGATTGSQGATTGSQGATTGSQGVTTGSQGATTGSQGATTGSQGATTGSQGTTKNSGTAGTHANPVNSVPAGSPSPISEPKVDDLAACLAACKGNPSCIAYVFESGVCKLYGPTVGRRQTHDAPINSVPVGSPSPISEPKVDDLAACLAACKGNPACIAYTFESGICKLFGPALGRRQQQGGATGSTIGQAAQGATTGAGNPVQNPSTGSSTTSQVGTHAAPVNAIPAGSPSPISEPKVDDLSACLAACKGNPACIAYTFESGVCKLFD